MTQSPIFSLLSFAIGLLGILLAVVFYIRTKRNKSMSFAHRSISIFKDNTPLVSKLQVKYDGKETKNLTLTHLAFWNSGNEIIRDIDLVHNDALRIVLEEGLLLDSELLFVSRKANNISFAELKTTSVELVFKFLDEQHGGVVRLVHTAKSRRNIGLKGTLMGAGEPKLIQNFLTYRVLRMKLSPFSFTVSFQESKWPFTIAVVMLTTIFIMFVVQNNSINLISNNINGPWRFFMLIILTPYWWLVFILHNRQIPKEMEPYLQDFGTETKI